MGETMNSINEFFQDGELWALVFAWGKNIGLAIVIFIIGRWIARALSRLMVRHPRELELELVRILLAEVECEGPQLGSEPRRRLVNDDARIDTSRKKGDDA